MSNPEKSKSFEFSVKVGPIPPNINDYKLNSERPISTSRSFYDLQGFEIKMNDRVWYDPAVVKDKSLCEKTYIVVGLSKSSDDILMVPEDNHTDLHRTLSYTVTHNNPHNHET